jgi:cytochrome c
LIIILAAAMSELAAFAAEFGTREEAIAMAKRVQQKFVKDGAEATFKAVNEGAPGFHDRDLFPVITDLQGLNAASWLPALRGKYLGDQKDQNGKLIVQEFISIAKGSGRGWSDTRVYNPVTKTIEDKSIYILRISDKYYVGVGVYKTERPNENTIGLVSGSPYSDETYLQIAYDLAEVLNDGDRLRIVPTVGIGGTRNIRDVRYLRGVDIGLTQTNILNPVLTWRMRSALLCP